MVFRAIGLLDTCQSFESIVTGVTVSLQWVHSEFKVYFKVTKFRYIVFAFTETDIWFTSKSNLIQRNVQNRYFDPESKILVSN